MGSDVDTGANSTIYLIRFTQIKFLLNLNPVNVRLRDADGSSITDELAEIGKTPPSGAMGR